MFVNSFVLSMVYFVPFVVTRPSISRHLVTPAFGPLEKMFTASNGKNPLLAATYYFNPSGLLDDSSLGDTTGDVSSPFADRQSVASKQTDRQINSRTRNGHHLKIHTPNVNDLPFANDLNSYADENENNNQQNLNELNELGSGYCISADDRKGICYNSNECTNRGGIPMGSCGDANSTPGSARGAVCCIFEVTCGDESAEPLVYIQNPDYPRATTKGRSNMCRIKIGKTTRNPVCQFKVNMVNFNIAPPLVGGGNCSNDVFVITGQNENNILPKICGFNDGQHYYFAVDESGVITFNFMLNYNHYYHERKFNLQLTQIPCSTEKLKAPPNCLQYLTGTYGSVKSFNYQVTSSASGASYARGRSNVPHDASNVFTTGYPNDLDYSICFKKEPGFCSITYELASGSDGRLSPFEIGSSESITGHRTVSSFTHTLVNSALSSRSSNRDVSKFNVVSNNHHHSVGGNNSLSIGHNNVTSTPSSSLSPHTSPVAIALPPSTTVIASQCTEDYLIVGGGIRLCSASIPFLPLSSISPIGDASSSTSDVPFNGSIGKFDLQSNHLLTNNGTLPVVLYTDFTSGPFALRFVSNSLGSARGFNLVFRQNPCN